MADVRKFSLRYDAQEDRIAWDMEHDDGRRTRLWLTQRLANRLVKALIPLVEKAAAVPPGAPEQAAAVQSFEQAAAMSGFGSVSPVIPSDDAALGLVRSVQIAPKAPGMILTFTLGANAEQILKLDSPAVRQALAVLRGLYQAAGWPADFWPRWLDAPGAPETRAALN